MMHYLLYRSIFIVFDDTSLLYVDFELKLARRNSNVVIFFQDKAKELCEI